MSDLNDLAQNRMQVWRYVIISSPLDLLTYIVQQLHMIASLSTKTPTWVATGALQACL